MGRREKLEGEKAGGGGSCFVEKRFLFHDCPLAGNKRRLFEIFF